MVRITGSLKDENSVNAPTGDSLTSVVRRRRGNSAKRINGTESRAPTKNPPTESNAPRKERLLSGDNPEPKECPASSDMQSPSASSTMEELASCNHRTPTLFTFLSAVPGGKPPISLLRLV